MLQAVKSNVALSGDSYSKVNSVNLKTKAEGGKLTNFDTFAGPCLTSLDINHSAYWKMDREEMGACLNDLKS